MYEKELLAIVLVVQKWKQYLLSRPFILRTDQKRLKLLLKKEVSTPFQQFWLSKLIGFEYEMQFRSGAENVVADALSKVIGFKLLMMAISTIQSDLFELITQTWATDPALQCIIEQKQQNAKSFPKHQLINGQLRKRGKLVVGTDAALRSILLHWVHSPSTGGHSGRDTTLKRLKQWKVMNKDVQHLVRQCRGCQACKCDTSAQPRLFQPLAIPKEAWVDIFMEFIEALPKSQVKAVNMGNCRQAE